MSEAGRESPESRPSDRSRRTCDRDGFESSEDVLRGVTFVVFDFFLRPGRVSTPVSETDPFLM